MYTSENLQSKSSSGFIAATIGCAHQIISRNADTVSRDQIFRELTQNGIDAIVKAIRMGLATLGLIQWDCCEHTVEGVRKLRVFDTGIGMTQDELMERVLVYGAQDQTGDNFGVGATITLLKSSPYGAVYYTLKDGKASTVTFVQSENGQWGAAEAARNMTEEEQEVFLPEVVRNAGHGTVVVLLGRSEQDQTLVSLNPNTTSDQRSKTLRWLPSILNDRYTSFPAGVSVRVQTFDKKGKEEELRVVQGSAHSLGFYSSVPASKIYAGDGAHGSVHVVHDNKGATINWWLLDSKKAEQSQGGGIPSYVKLGSRVRVVLHNEGYVNYGSPVLTSAGVWTGHKRVELHIIPDAKLGVTPDQTRSFLTINGDRIPVDPWCQAFKANLPLPIKQMLEDRAAAERDDGLNKSQNERLRTLYDDVRKWATLIARGRGNYRPSADSVIEVGHGEPKEKRKKKDPNSSSKPKPKPSDTPHSTPGTKRKVSVKEKPSTERQLEDIPAIEGGKFACRNAWVTIIAPEVRFEDDPDDELKDFAARYDAADHRLVVNTTYAAYVHELKHWSDKYGDQPGASAKIEHHLRRVYSYRLIEAVIGAQAYHAKNATLLASLLTPQALSTAVCARSQIRADISSPLHKAFRQETKCEADALVI